MKMRRMNELNPTGKSEGLFKVPDNLEAFYEEVFGEPRLIKKDGKWLIKPLEVGPFKEILGDKEVAETILDPKEVKFSAGTYLGYIAVRDFAAVKYKLEEFRCPQLTKPDDEYHKHLDTRAAFFYDPAGNLFNLIEHVED